jgi:hypothetical protein
MVFYFEKINLIALFYQMFFSIVKKKQNSDEPINCYYFDATTAGLWAMKHLNKWFFYERLDFEACDVRDSAGLSIRLRCLYQDTGLVFNRIIESKVYKKIIYKKEDLGKCVSYIEKGISINILEPSPLLKTIYLINIPEWHQRTKLKKKIVLFLEQRNWMQYLKEYANAHNTILIGIPTFSLKRILRTWLYHFPDIPRLIKRYRISRAFSKKDKNLINKLDRSIPKIVTSNTGQIHLVDKSQYSDVFFFQESELPGQNILLSFNTTLSEKDNKKLAEFVDKGINLIDISLQPSSFPISKFIGYTQKTVAPSLFSRKSFLYWQEKTKIDSEKGHYYLSVAYWKEFFQYTGGKVYISDFKYDQSHIAIAEAIKQNGGISAIYQRAYEEFSTPENAIDADVVFGFSPRSATIEKQNGSNIKYHITVGYPGDHRFNLLKPKAKKLREQILNHGAKKIIAYFDENSSDDARWQGGHTQTQKSYRFLLEKILADSHLGLIFKPKKPGTLRKRLGEVTRLLEKAQETGRCYVYEGGINSSFPPAGAALSADLVIHGYLHAGTAAVESALVGVPTLLLDFEGWHISPFYSLGLGKVVFQSWDSLWMKLEKYIQSSPVMLSNEWNILLDNIDPFRDGKAANRIGTFLHWLIRGFEEKQPRETVLEKAVEKYRQQWGADKVQTINRN